MNKNIRSHSQGTILTIIRLENGQLDRWTYFSKIEEHLVEASSLMEIKSDETEGVAVPIEPFSTESRRGCIR